MKKLVLFDGKSSDQNGGQFVFEGSTPLSTIEPCESRMVATVHEDTESFGEWTELARRLVAAYNATRFVSVEDLEEANFAVTIEKGNAQLCTQCALERRDGTLYCSRCGGLVWL